MTPSTSLQAFVGLFTLTKKRSEAYANADATVSLLRMPSIIHNMFKFYFIFKNFNFIIIIIYNFFFNFYIWVCLDTAYFTKTEKLLLKVL